MSLRPSSLHPVLRTASVVAFFFVLSACARLVPLTPQRAVLLSASFEDEAVRAAIIRALGEGHYVAEAEEPGRIVARYERRGTILRVEIHYTASQYEAHLLAKNSEHSEPTVVARHERKRAPWTGLVKAFFQIIR